MELSEVENIIVQLCFCICILVFTLFRHNIALCCIALPSVCIPKNTTKHSKSQQHLQGVLKISPICCSVGKFVGQILSLSSTSLKKASICFPLSI